MRIKVTQEDIDNGEQQEPERCPIALAIKRECPTSLVVVGTTLLEMNKNWPNEQSYLLPEDARDFIELFDNYSADDVEPFEFEIEGLKC